MISQLWTELECVLDEFSELIESVNSNLGGLISHKTLELAHGDFKANMMNRVIQFETPWNSWMTLKRWIQDKFQQCIAFEQPQTIAFVLLCRCRQRFGVDWYRQIFRSGCGKSCWDNPNDQLRLLPILRTESARRAIPKD